MEYPATKTVVDNPSKKSVGPTANSAADDIWASGNPILQLWIARRQRSQELKQLYESRWVQNWRWYRNQVEPLPDVADWWRSNEQIPTIFKIIETVLPRSVMSMFDAPDWFTVEARTPDAEQYERLCHALLQTSVEAMNIFPKMYESMKYMHIMGHCWGKVVWREEHTTRQVLEPTTTTKPDGTTETTVKKKIKVEEVFNGADFDWRPLDRVFPDPTGEGKWYVEEIDTTLEELQETQERYKIYDADTFAQLEGAISLGSNSANTGAFGDSLSDARSGTSAGVSVEYAREPEVTEGIPNHLVTPMRDGIGVKLWQCWGFVPKQFRLKDTAAWRLVVIAEGKHVLRDVPSPTPDGKPPYFPMKSIPIPGQLYGESYLQYIGPLADQQSRLANMRLDEVFLGVWQQYLMRKGSIASDNQLLMQPGGAIEVITEPGKGISDSFAVLPRRPVLPDAWNEDTYRQTQMEHVASATETMQGVASSSRQTATEVTQLQQQGNARHMLTAMWNDYTIKKELLTRTWQWNQMRMTKEKQVRIAGAEAATVDLSKIQEPIDIVVSGGLFALSRDTRVNMSQELIQMATHPAMTMWFKMGPILRRLLQDKGWKKPESFLKTDEEMMIEQLMQAAGEHQDAAAEGGPEGMPQDGSSGGDPAMSGMSNVPPEGASGGMAQGPPSGAGPPMEGPG